MARDTTNQITLNKILGNIYDADGKFIYTSDIAIDIAAGRVNGWSFMDKYGETGANVDSADGMVDVWNGVNNANCDKLYTWPTGASITHISSSNATDGQVINLLGQDINNVEFSQDATLDGQNKVALDAPFYRYYRGINEGATDLLGVVYIYEDDTISGGVPITSSKIKGIIDDGDNQSQTALYTIPAGKTGYLLKGDAMIISKLDGFMSGRFDIRKSGGVFQNKRKFGLSTTATSYIPVEFPIPMPIPEKTDIRVQVDSSVNNMNAISTFIILLEDN
jgi:hypothetical protein